MAAFFGSSLNGRPPFRPRARAAARPALVRSLMTSRSTPKLSPERTKLARRLIDEGQSVREMADSFNVSHRNHLPPLKDSGLSAFCVPLLANT